MDIKLVGKKLLPRAPHSAKSLPRKVFIIEVLDPDLSLKTWKKNPEETKAIEIQQLNPLDNSSKQTFF